MSTFIFPWIATGACMCLRVSAHIPFYGLFLLNSLSGNEVWKVPWWTWRCNLWLTKLQDWKPSMCFVWTPADGHSGGSWLLRQPWSARKKYCFSFKLQNLLNYYSFSCLFLLDKENYASQWKDHNRCWSCVVSEVRTLYLK